MSDRKERTSTGRFASGNPGRKKGSENKLTRSAKEAFQLAFDATGGWERMAAWAAESDDNYKTFLTLYARLIPTDHTTGGDKIPTFQIIAPNTQTDENH